MGNEFVLEFIKRLENSGIQYEMEGEGDNLIVTVVLPRTRIKCRYESRRRQILVNPDMFSSGLDIDNIDAISKDFRLLGEALER